MTTICKDCEYFDPAELNIKMGYYKPNICKALSCEKEINYVYGTESCKDGSIPPCHEINTNGNCKYYKSLKD